MQTDKIRFSEHALYMVVELYRDGNNVYYLSHSHNPKTNKYETTGIILNIPIQAFENMYYEIN